MTTNNEAVAKRKALCEAFALGFMISREGFNAECMCDHMCDGLQPPYPTTEEESIAGILDSEPFMKAMGEAVDRIMECKHKEEEKP